MARYAGIDPILFEYLRMQRELPEEVVYLDRNQDDTLNTDPHLDQLELFVPDTERFCYFRSSCMTLNGKNYHPASFQKIKLFERSFRAGTAPDELKQMRPLAESYYHLKTGRCGEVPCTIPQLEDDAERLAFTDNPRLNTALVAIAEQSSFPQIALAAGDVFSSHKKWGPLRALVQYLKEHHTEAPQINLWSAQVFLESAPPNIDGYIAFMKNLPDAAARKSAYENFYNQTSASGDLMQSVLIRLVREFPSEPKYQKALAQIYASQENYPLATDWMLRALTLDPSNETYQTLKQLILDMDQKVSTDPMILLCADAFLKLHPEDAEVWHAKAMALNRDDQKQYAIQALETAAALQPDNLNYKKELAILKKE